MLRMVGEFIRFCVVGLANTALAYGVFLFLITVDVHYLVAGAFGFLCGGILGFFLNRAWTFAGGVSFVHCWHRFMLAQLISLSSHSVAQAFAWRVGVAAEFTQFAGIAVSTLVNFYLMRNFVFGHKTLEVSREDCGSCR